MTRPGHSAGPARHGSGPDASGGAPILDVDPFSAAFLADPYACHGRIRDAGPVVYLPAYGIWAMARYAEVAAALKDWTTYASGRGVGLADFAHEPPGRAPSLLLETDPPVHDRMRSIIGRAVSRSVLQQLRPLWEAKAEALVETLAARGDFDGVTDLAEVFPLQVFPDAIGMMDEGRENLLPYGALAFNSFGPPNWLNTPDVATIGPILAWVRQACKRASLKPGGIGSRIFDAVDDGQITEAEGELLVRSFVTAGLDTTVNGLGNMLHAFAAHPDQYRLVRETPHLLPLAFEEVLRYDSTVQTFFRTTTRAVDMAGTAIPEGAKILLFLAAANRDPRKWENPDTFDIARRAVGHVGFGAGIHGCVGQMIARLEVEAILSALVRRVETIRLAGPPQRSLNNTLSALSHLPLRVE